MHYNMKNLGRLASIAVAFTAVILTGCQNNGNQNPAKSSEETTQNSEYGNFVSIFDGESLDGWEGAPGHWRVEDGQIIGYTTEDQPLEANTFLIWRDGQPSDFELKLDFKIMGEGNSGVQYRSEELSGPPLSLKGYQADIDGNNTYTGQNYEERGRGFLAKRGEIAVLENGKKPEITGSLGDGDELKKEINQGDWNTLHLIVKENHLKHYVNGVLMSEVTDNDTENRKMEGQLGLQIHKGPPMEVRYKNIEYKNLSN